MVKYVLKDRPAAVIVRKYLREKTWHSTFVISTYLLGRKFSSLFQFEWICKHFCYLAPANIIKKLKQSNQIASIQSTGMYTAACTKFNPPSSPWYAYHCFSLLLKTNKQLSPNHDNIDSIFQRDALIGMIEYLTLQLFRKLCINYLSKEKMTSEH